MIYFKLRSALLSSLASALTVPGLFRTRHLYNAKGDLYMARWQVIGQHPMNKDGTEDTSRVTPGSRILSLVTFGKVHAIRVHRIMMCDADRDLHNHPFEFWSLILRGWYKEDIPAAGGGKLLTLSRYIVAGTWNKAWAGDYHRIDGVSPGGVYTLFFMGKNNDNWGFLHDGQFVKSKEYFRLYWKGEHKC